MRTYAPLRFAGLTAFARWNILSLLLWNLDVNPFLKIRHIPLTSEIDFIIAHASPWHQKPYYSRRLGSHKHKHAQVRHSGFWIFFDFFSWPPAVAFFGIFRFFLGEGAKKLLPLHQPIEELIFDGWLAGFEKIIRPFTEKVSECALIRCKTTALCRKRRQVTKPTKTPTGTGKILWWNDAPGVVKIFGIAGLIKNFQAIGRGKTLSEICNGLSKFPKKP